MRSPRIRGASVYAAYRILSTDYEHAGFVYDIDQSGLLFGFGFRF